LFIISNSNQPGLNTNGQVLIHCQEKLKLFITVMTQLILESQHSFPLTLPVGVPS
jgi:hypothetical protein